MPGWYVRARRLLNLDYPRSWACLLVSVFLSRKLCGRYPSPSSPARERRMSLAIVPGVERGKNTARTRRHPGLLRACRQDAAATTASVPSLVILPRRRAALTRATPCCRDAERLRSPSERFRWDASSAATSDAHRPRRSHVRCLALVAS